MLYKQVDPCLVRGAENYDAELALSLAKWFFDLDIQHKMDLATKGFNKKNSNVYRGYFPVQPGNLSCKEGFEAGEEDQKAQEHLARKSFASKISKLDSWSPGAGFFPIGTIN